MSHPIVHIEIPAPDVAKSAAFYRQAFGWRVDEEEGGHYATFHPPEGSGSVGGGLDPSRAPFAGEGGIALYVRCDDIPAMLARVEAAGGIVVKPKTAVGGEYGFYGLFRDPAGNVLGVWSRA